MKKYIILVIFLSVIIVSFSYNSFVLPSSVDVYFDKGKHTSIENPSMEDLKPLKKIWNLWYTISSQVYPNPFPKNQYKSFEYTKKYKMIVFHYDTPIVWKGIKTQEIHLIYMDDEDDINNRVYVEDENGDWRFIQIFHFPYWKTYNLKSPILNAISNLTQ